MALRNRKRGLRPPLFDIHAVSNAARWKRAES